MKKGILPLVAVALVTGCEHTMATDAPGQARANEVAMVLSESMLVALVHGDHVYMGQTQGLEHETIEYSGSGHRGVVGYLSAYAELNVVDARGLNHWTADGRASLFDLGKGEVLFSGPLDFQYRIDSEQSDALDFSGQLAMAGGEQVDVSLAVSMDAEELDASIFFEGTVDGNRVSGIVSPVDPEVEEDPYEECRAPVGVDCD